LNPEGATQIIPFNTEPENIITIQSKYEFDSNCSKKPKSKNGKKREGERETHTHTIVDGSDGSYEKKPKKKNFTLLHRIHEGGGESGPEYGQRRWWVFIKFA
jgi:hypothetical protein